MVADGGYVAAFGGIPLTAVSGLTLALIWRHNIASFISKPFESIYNGGDQEVEARPVYSKAEKFRQRNQFNEAISEVRLQLEKFPNDFTVQLLMADIYANHLQDLQSAEIAVQKIINQPGHKPAQIASALHALADWHLKLAQDPDSARLALEKIVERFPDSQFSQMASQRIAHLGSVDSLLAAHERPTISLKHFDPYASLSKQPSDNAEAVAADAAKRASNCIAKLEQHPLDTEARENLAAIYAYDYQRLDLAADQLEQLISQPNQPARQKARWLNLLADWQIKIGSDISAAGQTIRRIQELFPKTALADQAVTRLEYLRLEAKGREKTHELKLGAYEKNLGLKKTAS
jgi:outer membrane protein assembly factor BamD (BamD/ComL family)